MAKSEKKLSKRTIAQPGVGSGKTVSRRSVVKAVGVAGGAAALGFPAPFVNAAQKEIRFLNGEPTVESVRAMKVAAAQYEKETGVKVQMDTVPVGKAFEKLQTGIKAGRPYDIGTLFFIGDVVLLASEGQLAPLNEIIEQYQWGPNILFPIDGNYYWYPYDYNLCWINYRRDLYDKHGLKEPANWTELMENMAKLKGEGDDMTENGILHPISSSSATNYFSFGYLWAEGGQIFDDNWNVVLDQGDVKKAAMSYLDYFTELTDLMPTGIAQAEWGVGLRGFRSGQLSHAPGTGRAIDVIRTTDEEMAQKIGIFPFPSSDGKQVAVNHGYDGWVVLNTPQTEEAMKFMKWFSDEHLINFLHTSAVHYQPARMDIYEDPRWLAHPALEQYSHITGWQKRFLTDPDVIIASIDSAGPAADLRSAKAFRSYALPEMLQNKILKGMDSSEAVDVAANKLRDVASGG